jgi:S-disulfanyl-L-cysteine oxidoreductase SoxD
MTDRSRFWWSAVASLLTGVLFLVIGSETRADSMAGRLASPQGTPQTVLDGVYTAGQADRGGAVYNEHCASCHDGADVDGPPLTGAPFIDRWREDTLAGLFEFIKTGMPQTAPGSLPSAAYLDVLAHLLHENDYPTGTRELTTAVVDSTLLVGPDGPQPLPSGALVSVVGCLASTPAREWTVAQAAHPARVRVGNDITVAEATAAAGVALGTDTFALQNVGDAGTPLPGEGHKVLVKGALSQRAGTSRIHVTAAKSVGSTCR